MVWQLHYTSAESGPTGRAGFQFVAQSPGLPDGLAGAVARHLTYRPPPGAPLSPSRGQILAMPAALGYTPLDHGLDHGPGREPGRGAVLARCVYLGRDYSGRYGNFLGHAVVLTEDDLVGLRPVEFWRAPLWSDAPAAPGTELPELAELTPGTSVDPESLGAWLASGGEDAYRRLALLLRTVHGALTRGHGRLVLVTGDVEDVVRWIAVISYSLPWTASARLSFLTYSADPASAPQMIVGTTPDVWLPSDIDATVVELDEAPPEAETGRFAGTVVGFWRRMDLDGIDALGEFGDEDPETVAALLALCRGDGSVSAAEQSAVAGLIQAASPSPERPSTGQPSMERPSARPPAAERLPTERPSSPGRSPAGRATVPGWVWAGLGRAAGLMGHELAAAVCAAGPPEAVALCAVRCAALAMRDPSLPPPARPLTVRDARALAPEAAAALGAARDLAALAGVVRNADAAGVPVDATDVERTVAELVRAGGEGLAEAVGRVPHGLRETVLAGAVTGLEGTSSRIRSRLLTPEVCALLAVRDWPAAPRTGAEVLRWLVESGRLGRVEATIALVRLAWPAPGEEPEGKADGETGGREAAGGKASGDTDGEASGRGAAGGEKAGEPSGGTAEAAGKAIKETAGEASGDTAGGRDAVLAAIWRDPPDAAECTLLLRTLGDAMNVSTHLLDLPARVFHRAGLKGPEVEGLAEQVRRSMSGGYPVDDAETALIASRLAGAPTPAEAARAVDQLTELTREGDRNLAPLARRTAAGALAGRDPRFRTTVMKRTSERTRRWLVSVWLSARIDRDEQLALLEIAIRLRSDGVVIATLDEWARSHVRNWSLFGSVEARFKRDPELAAGLRELTGPRRRLFGRGER
ncbi:hypothetical protein OG339_17795 [Streptosporangium sp. NBC_01495]|uniref:GAP1-N2 domain-containing protein n=1 Tax=Streptosporangium sp. NBC_01495 TaxID=2903899 RepID=UPI002E328B37|nr:hypothetical protein [Streptosporangium sp. NBC_01495]